MAHMQEMVKLQKSMAGAFRFSVSVLVSSFHANFSLSLKKKMLIHVSWRDTVRILLTDIETDKMNGFAEHGLVHGKDWAQIGGQYGEQEGEAGFLSVETPKESRRRNFQTYTHEIHTHR